MRLRLAKLQELDAQYQEIREERLKKGWEDVNGVLYYHELLYVSENICIKVMSRYHNDYLLNYFGMDKTRELIGQKYYLPILEKDIEAYVKGYNVFLALKAIKHKLYSNLQALPVAIHQ